MNSTAGAHSLGPDSENARTLTNGVRETVVAHTQGIFDKISIHLQKQCILPDEIRHLADESIDMRRDHAQHVRCISRVCKWRQRRLCCMKSGTSHLRW